MRSLIWLILAVTTCPAIGAAPAQLEDGEPAPVIEASGPVRVARYVKRFAQAEPIRVTRDHYARYTYGTPFYFYGCGYYGWYGCGWGWGYCHPICYPYGPYFPCY